MTLKRLVDLIRVEAQITGTSTMTGFIESVINEELESLTALDKYPELLVLESSLAMVAGQSYVTLPSDLQHYDMNRVRYLTGGDAETNIFLYDSNNFRGATDGTPRRSRRSGNKLYLFPYADTGGTDTIVIDYWKRHTTLVADSDVFPIPDLLPVVKARAIARLSRFSKTDRSNEFGSASMQHLSQSKGVR